MHTFVALTARLCLRGLIRPALIALVAAAMTACGGSDGGSTPARESATPGNGSPTIAGTPATFVTVGATYDFQPTGSDPDGNTLTYTIQNKPAWATFTASSGRLTGTPAAGNVGSYAGIVIGVSDGTATTALPPFTITVAQVSNGSATVNWTIPTQNTDGSALTNISGYQILYGTNPGALSQTVQITNPTLTTFVVENLSPGTWYFALKTVATGGQLSLQTNAASRVVP